MAFFSLGMLDKNGKRIKLCPFLLTEYVKWLKSYISCRKLDIEYIYRKWLQDPDELDDSEIEEINSLIKPKVVVLFGCKKDLCAWWDGKKCAVLNKIRNNTGLG